MNNKLKSKKLIKITIILAVLLVPIGLVASYPGLTESQFQSYQTGHSGGVCHGDNDYPGTPSSTGAITLTIVEPSVKTGDRFTVTARVTGFTEAAGDDVALGFISVEEDNGKFSFSDKQDPSLDGGGNSAYLDFTVTAPLEPDTYTIKITAVDSAGGTLRTATKTLGIIVEPNPPPTSYISAANYLVNTAENLTIGNNIKYRWEDYNGSTTYSVGWGDGVAGVGDFLIKAYNKSGNSLYLNYSIGAANWLWSIKYIDGNGAHWDRVYDVNDDPVSSVNFTGISQGSAGIGKFFLNLYRYTNNETYRNWAEEIAQYLENEDRVADPNEMAWRQDDSESDISHTYINGTTGIGEFLMDLEEATGNQIYRQWALNVSRYLINVADISGIEASWNSTSNAMSKMTGIWEGAAGIGNFLLDIYEKYGNTTAYLYANMSFNWLNSIKKITKGSFQWDYVLNDGEYHTSFGKGVAGISNFLSRLANFTGSATHWAVAQGALKYLIDNSTGIETSWWYDSTENPYQYTGKNSGMAGIGEAFLYALNYTSNATYAQMVEGIYTWYINTELRNDLNDSYSTVWRQSNKSSQINSRYSGIFDGAAGVGFFLLRRAEYLNDTFAPLPGYLKTAVVSGASVTLNVTNALDYESGLAGAAFYVVGPGGGQGFTNETYYTISLSTAGLYTAYAIIFDAVGNPSQRTNSTTFTITGTSTPPEDDDGGSRDLWEDPDILRIYIGIIASLGVLTVVISLTRKFLLENKQEQGLRRIKKRQK